MAPSEPALRRRLRRGGHVRRIGGGRRNAAERKGAAQIRHHHKERQQEGANIVCLTGDGDTNKLHGGLGGNGEPDGPLHPTGIAGLRHPGQQTVPRRVHKGTERALRHPIGDQQPIAEGVGKQHEGQTQGRDDLNEMQAHQPLPKIAPVRRGPAKQHEQQQRQHDKRLRQPDPLRRGVQHHRDQPRHQHHADPQRQEIQPLIAQIPGKIRRRIPPRFEGITCYAVIGHDRLLRPVSSPLP